MVSQSFKNRLKRAAIIGGTCTLLLLAATVGPQFIYLLVGLLAGACYLFFPDEVESSFEKWFEKNEHVMIGAAVGFIGGNVPGLCVGAWLGYYLHNRYQRGMQAAQAVADTFEPVLHPLNFTSRHLKRAWQHCQAGYGWFLNGIDQILDEPINAPQEVPLHHIDPVEAVREAVFVEVPAPVLLSQAPPVIAEPEPVVVVPPPEPEPSKHSRFKRLMDLAFPGGQLPTII